MMCDWVAVCQIGMHDYIAADQTAVYDSAVDKTAMFTALWLGKTCGVNALVFK